MDGEKPKLGSVKLHMDVIETARIVAAHYSETTISDLLSNILRPILAKMEEEAVARRRKPPKGKGGSKA